LQTDKACSHNI